MLSPIRPTGFETGKTAMTESDYLSLVLDATDRYQGHAGRGTQVEQTGPYATEIQAYTAQLTAQGFVDLANGRATITDLGRQHLVSLRGKLLYPMENLFPRE
jgi:hypothetical protein